MQSSSPVSPVEGARIGPAASTTDLQGFLAILRRHVGMVVLATLACVAAALFYVLASTKLYTSTAQLYIDPRPQRVVNEDTSLPGSVGADVAIVESQMSIISSVGVLGKVVDQLNLTTDEEFAPSPGLLSRIRQSLADRLPGAATGPEADPRREAMDLLARRIKANRAQKTYIIELEASAHSPTKAARILTALIEAYLGEQKAAKQQLAADANALIDGRLNELREQVRKADLKVDTFKQKNRIFVSEGGIVGEQQLSKLNTELINAQAAVATSKANLDQLERVLASGAGPDAIPEAVNSSLLQRLREQNAQVARRAAAMSSQLLASHPVMIEARSQVRQVRREINAELRRVVASVRSQYQTALNRQREIQRALEGGKAEVARSTTALIQSRALEQDATASRELLRTFLTRARETQEQQKTAISDARIVSPSVVPIRHSRPRGTMIIALGTLAGLGLGIALALLASLRDTALRTPAEILAASGLGTLAALPKVGRSGLAGGPSALLRERQYPSLINRFGHLLAALKPVRGSRSSNYRQAVFGLLSRFASFGKPGGPAIAMVVAADAGAGATSASLSVAAAAAGRGERVLLIDANALDAELSRVFAPDADADWSAIVKHKAALQAAVVHEVTLGLNVLALAKADLRSLRTAERRQLAEHVASLAQDYDLVLIDAGAVLDDESAMMLLPVADIVALVVRAGVTTVASLSETVRRLEPEKKAEIGVVLSVAGADAVPVPRPA